MAGYTQVDNDILQILVTLPGRAAAVYLVLRSHRNQKTGLCNPSQETISQEIGLDPRQVRRHIKTLSDAGILTYLTQTSRQGRSSNKYLFPAPDIPTGRGHTSPQPTGHESPRLRTSMSPPTVRTSMSPKQRRSQQDEDRPDDAETSERYIPTECIHIWNNHTCTRCGLTQLHTATN